MSCSPASKRNRKPSPTALAQPSTSQYTAVNEQPVLQLVAPATQTSDEVSMSAQAIQSPASGHRKRKSVSLGQQTNNMKDTSAGAKAQNSAALVQADQVDTSTQEPKIKKSRTNTPWTPAEELRLKQMRDAGNSWSEIAKTFPQRTEGSVKKHWYKDMHYAEFAEDESTALLAAIKEYDANKWKAIGQKVGKPAKACEQYAKEHFGGKY
ncbi:uncharacterized protein M421DRAFT_418813 [Didymella exigua CBS 183.55]|uniref:Myb-like transcription factor n=1 Tax=Didymella exigua CBS 183.55 TaxID=1150837 RepID=A0A6A5RTL6_9PLEO|nr:uncharacterized protein M421DRAFT_418813 [Didymella exigua CBS 183.55]KAF1930504.1 hypothetical protein M421DRAFT_418813 [Didymella exigua CBS 183.55]